LGDTVLEIDGELVKDRAGRLAKYYAASTPQSLNMRLSGDVLGASDDSPAQLKLRSLGGDVRQVSVPRIDVSRSTTARQELRQMRQRAGPVYKLLKEGYGYFDLARLTTQDVNAAFHAVKKTTALILDMRGYPNSTAHPLAARLTEKPINDALFSVPYWFWDRTDLRKKSVQFSQTIHPSGPWTYKGRVVVLINDLAISQSEWLCQCVEQAAKGRVTFIGTPTLGANGSTTSTSMPGGIRVRFTGIDVRHADGRQLQRVGIQPDIHVEPTIAGLVAGQDEVLAAAIKFLNEKVGRSGP
jgi:C-terminal processing protease CtpA/Prc